MTWFWDRFQRGEPLFSRTSVPREWDYLKEEELIQARKELDELHLELEATCKARDEIAANRQQMYVELTDEIARLKARDLDSVDLIEGQAQQLIALLQQQSMLTTTTPTKPAAKRTIPKKTFTPPA